MVGWGGSEERQWAVLDTVTTVADTVGQYEEVDATPAQVALRWLADHDRVTAPILGVRTLDQRSR